MDKKSKNLIILFLFLFMVLCLFLYMVNTTVIEEGNDVGASEDPAEYSKSKPPKSLEGGPVLCCNRFWKGCCGTVPQPT